MNMSDNWNNGGLSIEEKNCGKYPQKKVVLGAKYKYWLEGLHFFLYIFLRVPLIYSKGLYHPYQCMLKDFPANFESFPRRFKAPKLKDIFNVFPESFDRLVD